MIGKLITIVVRGVWRTRSRTGFIVASFAVAAFSYTVLMAIPLSIDRITNQASKSLRLIVTDRNATRAASTDWSTTLPMKYCDKVSKMQHVLGCAPEISWGGFYRDPRDVIMASGINADSGSISTIADYQIPSDLQKKFSLDRRNAMVGVDLMREHHWKLQEPVSLRDSEIPSRSFTFIPIAELTSEYLARAFWFNAKLLDAKNYYAPWTENRAAFIVVRVDAEENMGSVANEIDRNFHNSEAETQTNSESDSVAGIVNEIGGLKSTIYSLCIAILIMILLITGSSMAITVRDSISQMAVMRAIGFTRAYIATLLLSEAALIGFTGASIGAVAALLIFGNRTSLGAVTGPLGYVQVRPEHAIAAIAVFLFSSVAAATTPVLNAVLTPPAIALRKVV
jgi:putative ABC transport system permease protein